MSLYKDVTIFGDVEKYIEKIELKLYIRCKLLDF